MIRMANCLGRRLQGKRIEEIYLSKVLEIGKEKDYLTEDATKEEINQEVMEEMWEDGVLDSIQINYPQGGKYELPSE